MYIYKTGWKAGIGMILVAATLAIYIMASCKVAFITTKFLRLVASYT